jgi:hypothetical protein
MIRFLTYYQYYNYSYKKLVYLLTHVDMLAVYLLIKTLSSIFNIFLDIKIRIVLFTFFSLFNKVTLSKESAVPPSDALSGFPNVVGGTREQKYPANRPYAERCEETCAFITDSAFFLRIYRLNRSRRYCFLV